MKNINSKLMKKSLVAATSFALLGAFSSATMAEQKSGFTLTPMIGHMIYGGNNIYDDGTTFSLAAGYQYASPWGFELAYLDADVNQNDSDNTFSLEQLRLDALYHLASDTNFTPFAVFGVGRSKIEDDSDAMFNAGVGLKYAFNDLFSLRGDIRAIRNMDSERTDMGFNLGAQFLFGASSSKSKASTPVAPVDIDSDNDGVVDRLDSCLRTAAGVKVDAKGCAINTDIDGDGVANAQDACPDTKAGAKVDAKGCYLVLEEDVTVELNVNFANNADTIVNGADQIKKVADFMKQYPFTKVVVEGYTDSRGSDAYNLSLSQKRADAVAARLASNYGIDPSRVSAKGYGEANPIATNETAEGRAANRRVTAVVKATVKKEIK